jgi:hypothetical protein
MLHSIGPSVELNVYDSLPSLRAAAIGYYHDERRKALMPVALYETFVGKQYRGIPILNWLGL